MTADRTLGHLTATLVVLVRWRARARHRPNARRARRGRLPRRHWLGPCRAAATLGAAGRASSPSPSAAVAAAFRCGDPGAARQTDGGAATGDLLLQGGGGGPAYGTTGWMRWGRCGWCSMRRGRDGRADYEPFGAAVPASTTARRRGSSSRGRSGTARSASTTSGRGCTRRRGAGCCQWTHCMRGARRPTAVEQVRVRAEQSCRLHRSRRPRGSRMWPVQAGGR